MVCDVLYLAKNLTAVHTVVIRNGCKFENPYNATFFAINGKGMAGHKIEAVATDVGSLL